MRVVGKVLDTLDSSQGCFYFLKDITKRVEVPDGIFLEGFFSISDAIG